MYVCRDSFPPWRSDVKLLFAEELARRGHRVDWVLQSAVAAAKPSQVEFGRGTAYVARRPAGRAARLRATLCLLSNQLAIFKLLRDRDYDLLIVKDHFFGAVLPLLASLWNRVPLVYWLSYPYPEAWLHEATQAPWPRRLLLLARGALSKVLLYHALLPSARHAFVQSQQMREDIARHGLSPDRMTAVPMGVGGAFLNAPTEGSREDQPIVLYIGTMIRVRRLDFVLQAFARVRERRPDALLYMIGGEPADVAALQAVATELGLGNAVTITGPVSREEILDWIRRAHVGLSPFYPTPILNSTSPTKLIEYMSQGTPVVANDHPEQSRVIAASEAGLCVPWDEERFAQAILTILGDRDRAQRMGKKGREYALKHRSYDAIGDLVETQLLALREDPVPPAISP